MIRSDIGVVSVLIAENVSSYGSFKSDVPTSQSASRVGGISTPPSLQHIFNMGTQDNAGMPVIVSM